jgi:hypothetical protein
MRTAPSETKNFEMKNIYGTSKWIDSSEKKGKV